MKMKKIVCLVVALVMVVSGSAYAFAAPSGDAPNYPWVSTTTTTPTPATSTDPAAPTTEQKIAEVKAAYDNIVVKARSSVKTVNGKKAVALTWSFPADAPFDGYVVYKSTKKNSGFKAIKTVKDVAKKSFTDTKVKTGQKYYYLVKAYKLVDGVKVYTTEYVKAWRTVK